MKALFCLYSAPLIEGTSASSAPLASNLCSKGLGWETGLGALGALGVLLPSSPTLWLQDSERSQVFSEQ